MPSIWPRLPCRLAFLSFMASLPIPAAQASPLTYKLDQRYATIQFTTGGLVGAQGYFRQFKGNLALDFKNPQGSAIDVVVDDSAIEMPLPDGVSMLKSPAYFNSGKFPEITFRSISVKPESPTHFEIYGALTIRGVTRMQMMDAVLTGPALAASAPGAADFIVTGHLHRSDFGMLADRPMISDVVALTIHARIALQPTGTS